MNTLALATNPDAAFLANQRAALERISVTTTVLAPPGNHSVGEDEVRSRSVVDYVRFVPTVFRRSFGEYDLIHAHYGLTAPAAVMQPNLPVVLTLLGSDLFGEFGWLSKRCARHVDAVIVMSEEMATELGDIDAYVIPHGVDTDQFEPRPKQEAQTALQWRSDVKHVLFPYPRSRDVKDYPRAERVTEAVRRRVDYPIELHTLTGIPHEQMPLYMNASDVLLMTSKHEGSPGTVKEALACNLPVVSTDVGDVAERLEGVRQSYVCQTDDELVDALHAVLEHGGRSNGRKTVQSLTVEATAEKLVGVYRSVLDSDINATTIPASPANRRG